MAVGSDERTTTPEAVAKEICDAWLEGHPDESERTTIEKLEAPYPDPLATSRERELAK
ncbi:MAG TPA: hypothetical protein VIT43_00455 [Candidatus Dormibacteraeota bacterium]